MTKNLKSTSTHQFITFFVFQAVQRERARAQGDKKRSLAPPSRPTQGMSTEKRRTNWSVFCVEHGFMHISHVRNCHLGLLSNRLNMRGATPLSLHIASIPFYPHKWVYRFRAKLMQIQPFILILMKLLTVLSTSIDIICTLHDSVCLLQWVRVIAESYSL